MPETDLFNAALRRLAEWRLKFLAAEATECETEEMLAPASMATWRGFSGGAGVSESDAAFAGRVVACLEHLAFRTLVQSFRNENSGDGDRNVVYLDDIDLLGRWDDDD